MNMKSLIDRWFLPLVLVAITGGVSFAQSVTNSAYNVFGLGSLDQQGLVPYESLGYAAIGSRSDDMVNIENPAALTSIKGFTQIFDVGITFSQLRQVTDEESFGSSFGGIHDLNYWFRSGSKTAFSLGISKFSDANYDILDSSSGNTQNTRSDSRHLGEGGSSFVFIGAGHSLTSNFHVGMKANFLFGNMNSNEVVALSDPDANLDIEKTSGFVKAIMEFGLQYEVKLNQTSDVTLGSTFRSGSTIDLDQETTIISNTGNSLDSLFLEENSAIKIPRKLGFGASFKSKSWLFNVDYEFENWSANDNEENFTYQDRFITSFGVQFTKDPYSEKFLNRLSIRAGGGVHTNYIKVENQNYLSQYYTLGVGIPISRGAAALNFNYQFYATGTTDANLIHEYTNTFSFNVSIKDLWFRKRAFN